MTAREIEDQAARWVARRDRDEWDEAQEAELEAWLAKSTAHRVAFLRLDAAWGAAARLSVLNGPMSAASLRSPRRLWLPLGRMAAAVVAMAAVIGGATYFLEGQRASASFTTQIGQRETIPLADGTKVELNTDSELRADVTPTKRTVWLDRGEAYFEVAHDKRHPFTVLVGDRRITVLGTKFSVRRDGDGVEVVVAEGRVRVETLDHPAPPTIVTRDDIAIAKSGETLVAMKSPQDVSAALGWRHGLLIFGQATLSDVAEEFNRYNEKKIVVTDATAAHLRLGGTFEATNLDAFVRLLEHGFGLKVVDKGDVIEISN